MVGVDGDARVREYEGLKRVVGMIARHPDFPGKRDAVMECMAELVERSRRGRLTPDQRAELMAVLLEACPGNG